MNIVFMVEFVGLLFKRYVRVWNFLNIADVWPKKLLIPEYLLLSPSPGILKL
jgi:hypothetical protein